MSVQHLPFLNPDRWYVINVYRGDDRDNPNWRNRLVSLHGPRSEASAEWSVLGKNAFGVGFQLGWNGGESDLGLDLYAWKLGSVWLRLRAPWTKWARMKGYEVRHAGIRLFPYEGCWVAIEIAAKANSWSRSDPWWMRMKFGHTELWGRTRSVTIKGKTGECLIPLPEGNYKGTWTEERHISRFVRFPGTLRDRIIGPRSHSGVDLKIEGGIPIEGKGENSWDCGMDGLFGCGGATVADAIGNAVRSVLRGRQNYGGPHNLPRPMTVQEAEAL